MKKILEFDMSIPEDRTLYRMSVSSPNLYLVLHGLEDQLAGIKVEGTESHSEEYLSAIEAVIDSLSLLKKEYSIDLDDVIQTT